MHEVNTCHWSVGFLSDYWLTAIYRAQRSQHSDWNANSFAANVMPAGDKKNSLGNVFFILNKSYSQSEKRIKEKKDRKEEKSRLRSSPLSPSVRLNRTIYVASHSAHSATSVRANMYL